MSVMSSWATRSESSRCRAVELRPATAMASTSFRRPARSRSAVPARSMRTSSRATPLPGFDIVPAGSDVVEGNLIGTDVAGTGRGPNAIRRRHRQQPSATRSAESTSGAGNVISGNSGDGIEIDGGSCTIIQGNTVGSSPGLGNRHRPLRSSDTDHSGRDRPGPVELLRL